MFRGEEYDRWFDSKTGRYIWSLERPLIMEMLELKPGETLLDIGCGTGRLLQAVGNCRTVGLDRSPDMLSLAHSKGIKNLVQGFAEALPFPDQSFDAVILITVLEFVQDPEKVMREALRVCRNRLILGVLNRRSLLYLIKRLKGIFTKTSYKTACFHTERSLRGLSAILVPDSTFEAKTTLAMPLIPVQAAWLEQRLTETGFPFGGFLVVRVFPRKQRGSHLHSDA